MRPYSCPFCAAPSIRVVIDEKCISGDVRSDRNGFACHCEMCEAEGPLADSEAVAIAAWNAVPARRRA